MLNDVGPFIPWSALYRLKGYVDGGQAFKGIAEAEAYLRAACEPFGPLTDEQWRHLAEHSAAAAEDGRLHMRYDPAIGDTMGNRPRAGADELRSDCGDQGVSAALNQRGLS